jgi:hypothetical protein
LFCQCHGVLSMSGMSYSPNIGAAICRGLETLTSNQI